MPKGCSSSSSRSSSRRSRRRSRSTLDLAVKGRKTLQDGNQRRAHALTGVATIEVVVAEANPTSRNWHAERHCASKGTNTILHNVLAEGDRKDFTEAPGTHKQTQKQKAQLTYAHIVVLLLAISKEIQIILRRRLARYWSSSHEPSVRWPNPCITSLGTQGQASIPTESPGWDSFIS